MPEKNELPMRCANTESRCRLWNRAVDDPDGFVMNHPELKVKITGAQSSLSVVRETTLDTSYSQG